jgi:serine/threonine-protein kinase
VSVGTLSLAGQVLGGKYRLLRPLGEGSMGVVWAAEHVLLGRPLAVKLLRPELVSVRGVLERFQQEAVAAGRIGSPHIVDVLDVGTAPNGAPFIVMEFLRGRSLAALLRLQATLTPQRTVRLGRQILAALEAAHAAGIIHRDLKPDNIFLEPGEREEEHVKLVDFGISKAKDDPRVQHLTRTGMLLGTPRYMSPEQVRGEKSVDERADLWAAGVILYQCLSGVPPHDGPDLGAILGHILLEEATPLRELRPEVEPWLEAAVMRALEKDRERRFASATEFREALTERAALPTRTAPPAQADAEPLRGAETAEAEPSIAPPRRRTGLWIALALLLLAGAGVGAFLVFGNPADGTGAAADAGPARVDAVGADAAWVDPWLAEDPATPVR